MFKPMEVRPTDINGLWRVDFKTISDERGSVMEFYRKSEFDETGLPSLGDRPQTNAPLTERGGLRGIHAELAHKLVCVGYGAIHAVIVDLRPGSRTVGEYLAFDLQRGQGLFVSRGLGNSFQSVSEHPSAYLYYFEQEWQPDMPGSACTPLDDKLAISWPFPDGQGMILSEKDRANPKLDDAIRLTGEAVELAGISL